jgi:serine/threonine protein kinase
MALSPGDKLGPYEILSPIGAGGMGEVYRAKDTRLDREDAVERVPSTLVVPPVCVYPLPPAVKVLPLEIVILPAFEKAPAAVPSGRAEPDHQSLGDHREYSIQS